MVGLGHVLLRYFSSSYFSKGAVISPPRCTDLIRLERDSSIEDLYEQFEALKREVGIKAA
jgi:hypothetical protein